MKQQKSFPEHHKLKLKFSSPIIHKLKSQTLDWKSLKFVQIRKKEQEWKKWNYLSSFLISPCLAGAPPSRNSPEKQGGRRWGVKMTRMKRKKWESGGGWENNSRNEKKGRTLPSSAAVHRPARRKRKKNGEENTKACETEIGLGWRRENANRDYE